MDAILRYDDVARREETVRLGLWMFLATVAMLFAAFASAYIVRRSGSDWTRINLPPVLWLNTWLLCASSVGIEVARAAGSRSRWFAASVAFGVALALGVGFVLGQVAAWEQLMSAGVYMPASPHSSFFYMLTGAHALHVVAALGVLLWAASLTWTGIGQRHPRRWAAALSAARTFWHFLLAVWFFIFILMSRY